ncbi:MAG: hypothetical protein U0324_30145 [Polyangiales bacterium]
MRRGDPSGSARPEPTLVWAALGLSVVVNFGAALAISRREPGPPSDAGARSADPGPSPGVAIAALGGRVDGAEREVRRAHERIAAIEQSTSSAAATPATLRKARLAEGDTGQSVCMAIQGVCVGMLDIGSVDNRGREGRDVFTCQARLHRPAAGQCSTGGVAVIDSTFYPSRAGGGFERPILGSALCISESEAIEALCALPAAVP